MAGSAEPYLSAPKPGSIWGPRAQPASDAVQCTPILAEWKAGVIQIIEVPVDVELQSSTQEMGEQAGYLAANISLT